MTHDEIYNSVYSKLALRRNYQREIQELVNKHEYVVFYGCGAILDSIVNTWNKYIDRPIDFCCDSNSEKWGSVFSGIRCVSPDELSLFKDKCVVFVTIGEFLPVYRQLQSKGFISVHILYKYDLETGSYLANEVLENVSSKLYEVYLALSDDVSRDVFVKITNRVLLSQTPPEAMVSICSPDQYFPKDIIKLGASESFVDVGAFVGDTFLDFVKRCNAFETYHGFELDAVNYGHLLACVNATKYTNCVKMYNVGALDHECDVAYSIGLSQSTIGSGVGKGHCLPLDNVLRNEYVSMIKMDIEGSELQALQGASQIIKMQKPKLAICVYHKFSHLWEIPLYIKSLVPEYKIYLRHHTNLEYETVCYAVLETP